MSKTSKPVEADARVHRTIRKFRDGLLRLDQRISVPGCKVGTDVSGHYWILGLIEVFEGEISYLRGKERVRPSSSFFCMFVPPFSLIQVECVASRSYSRGLCSRAELRGRIPREPILFYPRSRKCPGSISEVEDLLNSGLEFFPISREIRPSALSLRAKRRIDAGYSSNDRVSDVAARLGVCSSALSRQFRRDFGMPPVRYRQWLRTVDAMMQLLEGRAIVDTAHEVGFEDLGRFYKNFKRITRQSPGHYYREGIKKRQELSARS